MAISKALAAKAKRVRDLAEVREIFERVVKEQPHYALGHGFMTVIVNGKRECIGYIDGRHNHNKIVEAVSEHEAVEMAWVMLD